MFLVQLIGEQRSFFTDEDPSLPTYDLFNVVEVVEFRDSYTSHVPGRREGDALKALLEGSTRTARINYRAVASSIEVEVRTAAGRSHP
jgi:hypothetical protein